MFKRGMTVRFAPDVFIESDTSWLYEQQTSQCAALLPRTQNDHATVNLDLIATEMLAFPLKIIKRSKGQGSNDSYSMNGKTTPI